MACTGVYRFSALAYYVVMENSIIFTGIGDVDTRSFHWQGRDTGFPCLLGYNKQERPQMVDHYIYKHFTYSLKSTTDKQASIFTKSFRNFYRKANIFMKSVKNFYSKASKVF